MPDNLLGQLSEFESDSPEQILREMFTDDNIEMKSDFKNPLAMSKGRLLVKWLRIDKHDEAADLMEDFLEFFERDVVSNKRQGRTEIISAIAELIKRDQGMKDKLLGKDGGI